LRICIVQSCYIPWKGFFDLIGRCDEYVIYDSAQFVKQHWFNRNRIKTPNGTKWLSIPVVTSSRLGQPINQVEIAKPWADQHWSAIKLSYGRAPFFTQFESTVKAWYEQAEKQTRLTSVNAIFVNGIAEMLGLKTQIVSDAVYPATGDRMERLLQIVQAAGATHYLSGPSAQAYFDESMFATANIATEWMSYDGYAEYPQLYGEFEHGVTILDLIFNAGPEAQRYYTCKVQ
jgi:hypothetical protein